MPASCPSCADRAVGEPVFTPAPPRERAADPWLALAAAIDRRAASGRRLGDDEGPGPAAALELFLSPLDVPRGPPGTVAPGAPADLVLLDAPLGRVLAGPSADHVVATVIGGVLHRR